MDIDSARLAQFAAARLVEFGHDAGRSCRGARALLLDVLA